MLTTLILGAEGMLGGAVLAEAASRGHVVDGPARGEVDVCDTAALEHRLQHTAPELVINCAALTDVDGCEERRTEAFEVNGHAVERLGKATERQGALLLHVSTDYVFSGDGRRPYGEDDETGPRSVYGQSKRLGEGGLAGCARAVVVRTSWLFGPGGRNFVDTIARRAVAGATLRVVDDQLGAPTYAPFLARALVEIGEEALRGELELPQTLHYRNREPTSWHGFAVAVVASWGAESEVVPVPSTEARRAAPRPAYSVLDVSRFERLMGRRVEQWSTGLAQYRASWSASE